MNIRVKNSGIVKLQEFNDKQDGWLVIAESGKQIPFTIKRVYHISRLGNSKATRGKHAHRKTEQVIFCINGSFRLRLDDGQHKQELLLKKPSEGVRLGPMLWHEMSEFSKDCVILVFAAELYNEKDYIRSYKDFLNLVR